MGLVAEREEQRNGERAAATVVRWRRSRGRQVTVQTEDAIESNPLATSNHTRSLQQHEDGKTDNGRNRQHETDATVKIRAAETRIVTALKGSANFVGDESGRMWSEKAMSDV